MINLGVIVYSWCSFYFNDNRQSLSYITKKKKREIIIISLSLFLQLFTVVDAIIASTTITENCEVPPLNFDLHQVCWFTVSQWFSVFKYNNVHLAWH